MALGDLLALLALRLLHLDDELGFLPWIADARAGLLVGRIRGADAAAGVGFHHHLVTVRDQLAHQGGRQADAELVGLDPIRDADGHPHSLTVLVPWPRLRLPRRARRPRACG